MAVPGSRTALQTANALASVNRIAPGRVVYGIGTGHTARRTMGLPPMRLSEFGQYVRDVQALLNGERVRVRANGDESTGQFIYPAQVHMNLDDHIPIYVSAWGPRALELAGEVGDAVFVRGSYRGAEQVRQGLEKGAVKAGTRGVPALTPRYRDRNRRATAPLSSRTRPWRGRAGCDVRPPQPPGSALGQHRPGDGAPYAPPRPGYHRDFPVQSPGFHRCKAPPPRVYAAIVSAPGDRGSARRASQEDISPLR